MWTRYGMLAPVFGMGRELDRMLQDRIPVRAGGRSARTRSFVPAVDSFEREGKIVLRAELPGVEPTDVDVTVEHGVLVLKGEKKNDLEKRDGDSFLRERYHGTFERRFTLPEEADGDGIVATASNGVLEIEIPKISKPEPRRIPVRSGADGSERAA